MKHPTPIITIDEQGWFCHFHASYRGLLYHPSGWVLNMLRKSQLVSVVDSFSAVKDGSAVSLSSTPHQRKTKRQFEMQSPLDFYIEKIDGFVDMDYQQRREAATKAGLADKQHTKTSLKEIFRAKPAKDAVSEYEYKGDYGNHVQCYMLKQCVAMRNPSKASRTKAQIEATEKLTRKNQVNSRRNKAALLAKECVDSNRVIAIDTETTDLYGKVISIALVDVTTTEVIYSSLVHTDDKINLGAYEVHGISDDDIKDAPSFEEVCIDISELMRDKSWTAFNLKFDKACMENSRHDPNAECYKWLERMSVCVMYDIAVAYFGATNRHGTISLADTMYCCGLSFEGEAHTASADAKAVARVLQYVGKQALI